MPYRCLECGYDKFEGWATEKNCSTVYFNDAGEIDDWGKDHGGDGIVKSGMESCDKCNSSNFENIPNQQLENWEMRHFDSEGTFHKEGLSSKIDKEGNIIR